MLASVDHDWALQMSDWAYAYGEPKLTGQIKKSPNDFQVIENLGIVPCGEGEHIWLQITKQRQNTDKVAKALARHASVAYRDVGYSGLKDFNAVTQQWFSIYHPKNQQIDWDLFEFDGVQIDQVHRHTRKIKRGTHQSNDFKIKVCDIEGDASTLDAKIAQIQETGVPNYFGEQRFGRNLNNMHQAQALLVEGQSFKDRNLKSILYSSARSWLFNEILSTRIKNNSWAYLHEQEPANLNGSNSVFNAVIDSSEMDRLSALDIHPTAPMWGRYKDEKVSLYGALHEFEKTTLNHHADLCAGLEKANLSYKRRALRLKVNQFESLHTGNDIVVSFNLMKGQFATSVIRELFVT